MWEFLAIVFDFLKWSAMASYFWRKHEAKKAAQAVADAPKTADELAERLDQGDV